MTIPASMVSTRDRGIRIRTLVAVCAALFLALFDSTVVTLALPTIGRELGVGLAGLQWTVDSYILCYASLLLMGGVLGDRFGRSRMFIAGMAIFVFGSVLCAVSGSLAPLVAARAVQGIGAAAITPQTLAILSETFPEPAQRARAFGIWSGVSGLALVLGPLLGGALVQELGWPSVFLLNVPICLVAMGLMRRLPAEAATGAGKPVHLRALLLIVVSLGGLTFVVIEGGRIGWSSPIVLAVLCAAAGSLAALLLTQARSRQPALALSLFRIGRFAGATSVTFLVAFGLNGVSLLLSLLFQHTSGMGVAAAGQHLLPTMVAIVVAALLGGRIAARRGSRPPVVAGTAVAGTSLLVLAFLVVQNGYGAWWPSLVGFGLGVGLVMSPNNAALMASAPAESAGQASAMNGLFQQAGALLGIAALGSLGIQAGLLAAGVCYLAAAGLALTLFRPPLVKKSASGTYAPPGDRRQ